VFIRLVNRCFKYVIAKYVNCCGCFIEVLSEEDNVEMVEGGMLQEVSASCTSIQPSDDEGCNQVADLPTTTSEVKESTSAKTPHLSRK
jgi:hypothetical protein